MFLDLPNQLFESHIQVSLGVKKGKAERRAVDSKKVLRIGFLSFKQKVLLANFLIAELQLEDPRSSGSVYYCLQELLNSPEGAKIREGITVTFDPDALKVVNAYFSTKQDVKVPSGLIVTFENCTFLGGIESDSDLFNGCKINSGAKFATKSTIFRSCDITYDDNNGGLFLSHSAIQHSYVRTLVSPESRANIDSTYISDSILGQVSVHGPGFFQYGNSDSRGKPIKELKPNLLDPHEKTFRFDD